MGGAVTKTHVFWALSAPCNVCDFQYSVSKNVHMHIMVVYCPKTWLELSSVNDWPVVYRIQVLNFRAHGNIET